VPSGPAYDLVGDVHGCADELDALLTRLGWRLGQGAAEHPEGRVAVFVGDLVDRGPDTPRVLRRVMAMVETGSALCVQGNHEAKLLRALDGADVQTSPGLQASLDQLAREPAAFRSRVRDFLAALPWRLVLDEGRLVVTHAGLREDLHTSDGRRARAFALYGDTTGETDEHGMPVRLPWQDDYRGAATVVYGHTPLARTRWVNGTLCLDTGAVFGNRLTALRYPEGEQVDVPAERQWAVPGRPLG
jgi:diadenosine tetraphosphatase ApaH/serine/threonine PP2A family protein phosphatase